MLLTAACPCVGGPFCAAISCACCIPFVSPSCWRVWWRLWFVLTVKGSTCTALARCPDTILFVPLLEPLVLVLVLVVLVTVRVIRAVLVGCMCGR